MIKLTHPDWDKLSVSKEAFEHFDDPKFVKFMENIIAPTLLKNKKRRKNG